MILLLQAYSRRNAGDGLLVDESLHIIRQAVGNDMPVVVLASDAASFSPLPNVREMPGGRAPTTLGKVTETLQNLGGAAWVWAGGKWNMAGLNDLLPQVKAVVGVGGAYLRAGHLREKIACAGVMFPQMVWAGRCGKPTVYLPQSVGPLKGILGSLIRSELRHIGTVCVRDDRSKVELGPKVNTVRLPDLAVLALGRLLTRTTDAKAGEYPRIYLVARDLPKSKAIQQAYYANLRTLRELLPEAEPLVQSRGRGNDDNAFYQRMGWGGECRNVQQALKESGPGIMVSVRLHGALQAIMAGCPTVHVTYERKGFGAYTDLGIMDYLHVASHFDPHKVAQQVRALQGGAPFWSNIAKHQPTLKAQGQQLVDLIKQAVASTT